MWGTEHMPPLPDGWHVTGRRVILENGCKVTLKQLDRRGSWRRFAITVDDGELPSLEPGYLVLLCTSWPEFAEAEVRQMEAGAWLLEVI